MCVAVYATVVMLLWCALSVYTLRTNKLHEDNTSCIKTCLSSLFVISTIIVTDIYVHSLVELKIKKCFTQFIRIRKILLLQSVQCLLLYVGTIITSELQEM